MTVYASKSAATTSYGTVSSLKITVEEGTRTCQAFWKWSKSHTSGFTVHWDYKNADGVWVIGNASTVTYGTSNKPSGTAVCDTYTAPDNAYSVRIYVKPVSKTRSITYYTSTKKTTTKTATVAYFTASGKTSDSKVVGLAIDAPSVSAEYAATNRASLTIESGTYDYAVYRYEDGHWSNAETSAHVRVPNSSTTYSGSKTNVYDSAAQGKGLVSGHSYKYATRAFTTSNAGSTFWGNYSDFSDKVDAVPLEPEDFEVAAKGSDGDYYFKATWTRGSSYSGNDESYRIRWAQAKSYISAGVNCEEDETDSKSYSPTDFIDDISAPWYFGVRAENNGGDAVSSWVYAGPLTFGETPSAPTVASVPSYVEETGTITVSWTHNTKDGSAQTAWLLEGSIDSGSTWSTIAASDDDTATVTSYIYSVGTLGEEAGGTIRFRVSTAGTTGTLSATTQTADVTIIAVMSLSCAVAATVESLPVEFVLTSNLQVRAWAVEVTAAESYETTSLDGDERVVAEGARVYSAQIASGDTGFGDIAATISIDSEESELVDGATYAYAATAISVYGTTGDDSGEFYVNFDGEQPEPTMVALYDEEAYECHLFPVCWQALDAGIDGLSVMVEDYDADGNLTISFTQDVTLETNADGGASASIYLLVNVTGDGYTVQQADVVTSYDGETDTVSFLDGYVTTSAATWTADELAQTYLDGLGIDFDTMDMDDILALFVNGDVTLDVFRRDPNGDLLVVAEDVENTGKVELVDIHCNFGTSTYRVRAVDSSTGMVGFMDTEVETAHYGIVLQFEDGYRQYTGSDDAAQDETGIIELPYNATVAESYSPDVTLAEYIGNAEPTLYTGTQRGATVTSTAQAIKVTDSDTIAKLRRYAGSVSRAYYRDSTGLSFWAWATVTLTHAYNDAAVDCALSLTRILGDYSASQTTEVL